MHIFHSSMHMFSVNVERYMFQIINRDVFVILYTYMFENVIVLFFWKHINVIYLAYFFLDFCMGVPFSALNLIFLQGLHKNTCIWRHKMSKKHCNISNEDSLFCKTCCRLMYWFLNVHSKMLGVWQRSNKRGSFIMSRIRACNSLLRWYHLAFHCSCVASLSMHPRHRQGI